MQWLLFTDKNFLHFVVLKVLQDGEIIIVVCIIIKERRLNMLVAKSVRVFPTIDLMHNDVILWSRRLKSFENGYS